MISKSPVKCIWAQLDVSLPVCVSDVLRLCRLSQSVTQRTPSHRFAKGPYHFKINSIKYIGCTNEDCHRMSHKEPPSHPLGIDRGKSCKGSISSKNKVNQRYGLHRRTLQPESEKCELYKIGTHLVHSCH